MAMPTIGRDEPRTRTVLRLPREILQLRFRGAHGGVIRQHRALATIGTWVDASVGVAIGAVLSLGVVLTFPAVCGIWEGVLRFWHRVLGLPGQMAVERRGWEPYFAFDVPFPNFAAREPGPLAWGITALVVLALVLVSLPLARRLLPLAYVFRAVAVVQGTALLYFALTDRPFPHQIPGYTRTMLLAGLGVMGLAPLLLGITYNVYDVGLGRKVLLALLAELHLLVLLPHQYMLHVLLIHHGSLLVLPPLYFLFGLVVDVVVLVGWFGWAMSWPVAPREERVTRPPGRRTESGSRS